MKIIVFIKQTVNIDQNIRIKESGKINEKGLEFDISACDECAIEEALRIKDKNKDTEVTLVCMGPARAKKVIRKGLALGADRAIHLVNGAYNSSDATVNARIFASVLKAIPHDVVLCGKQAQDTDMQATAEILSEMLGLPMASNCVKMDMKDAKAVVHRQADRHLEVIELARPCIITVNNDINDPRYPTLRGIMTAMMKPVLTRKPTDFGLSIDQIGKAGSLVERITYEMPQARPAGKKFEGDVIEITERVIELLTTEAGITG